MRDRGDERRLDVAGNGIVHRTDDGIIRLMRPSATGLDEVVVDRALADRFELSTGDVVEGDWEAIEDSDIPEATDPDECWDYDEVDEPAAVRGQTIPEWLTHRRGPVGRLLAVHAVNGIAAEEARDRPAARLKRSSYERAAPDRWISLGVNAQDATGRTLDVAAPFALGYAGLVYGPHGAGLTRTVQAVAKGVLAAAGCELFVLLTRSRSEEVTDWRRRFPEAELIVCPAGMHGSSAEEAALAADLALAAAQRQTELGRHVVLLVDSLTGLWASMLESEEADAQREADRSWSRQRIREWMQAAGNFAGEGLLGAGLGGSLTIVGSAWSQPADTEAEEEGEMHPHLRLLEHVLPECGWRVSLSRILASGRLFPAIRVGSCLSRDEDRFMPDEVAASIRRVRVEMAERGDIAAYSLMMAALDSSDNLQDALSRLLARGPGA